MKSASRVARPSRTGSTPSAIGSRVPACPTRFWAASPRTFATTSCDVQPVGLWTFRTPVRSGRAMLALLFDGADELHDARTSSQRAIEDEFEMGRVAQLESLLEVVVQEARRAVQAGVRGLDYFLVAIDAEVNLGRAQVR